jgi:hypothetical protein
MSEAGPILDLAMEKIDASGVTVPSGTKTRTIDDLALIFFHSWICNLDPPAFYNSTVQ